MPDQAPAAEESRIAAAHAVVQGRAPTALELRASRENWDIFERRLASNGIATATSLMCLKLCTEFQKKHGHYPWKSIRDDFLDDFLSKSFEVNLGEILLRYKEETRPETRGKIDSFLGLLKRYNNLPRHRLIVNHDRFRSVTNAFMENYDDARGE